MVNSGRLYRMRKRGLSSILLLCVWDIAFGQVRYSIPEETGSGAFVGNIAHDLGLELKELSARRFRIVSGSRPQYFGVNLQTGILFVNKRIDREQLCGQSPDCVLPLEVVTENPVNLHRVEVEIQDINDNSPIFPKSEIRLEIFESASPGTRFLLEGAQDSDVGTNSIRTYELSTNKYFSLNIQTRGERKLAELVLEKSLDREQESLHNILLTAIDGGTPERSGTAYITVVVLDANDNSPVFQQSLYKVSVRENAAVGTLVIALNATDLDEGFNSDIEYSFSDYNSDRVGELFSLDSKTGKLSVKGVLDFEEADMYEINIEAKDKGSYAVPGHCTVVVNIDDVNDNVPELTFVSLSNTIREDSPPGTVIALISVTDYDSGDNSRTSCQIPNKLPFELKSSFKGTYTLKTKAALDRETAPEYKINITCRDDGSPALSSHKIMVVKITDINDNAPKFESRSYTAYVMENSAPGSSICSVTALDSDSDENSHLSYSILESQLKGIPISSYLSINSESGIIYSQRSFDYEQFKNLLFHVQARDGGVPSLGTNITVNMIILDQNDNAPEILSPLPKRDPKITVPPSADPGYLVTKVSATDADSGQNARLSYQLVQATDPSLFKVGLSSGQIRTTRRVADHDLRVQRLVIMVRDNGHPPLSVSTNIEVSIVDNNPETRSDFRDVPNPPERSSNFAMYIIISLGALTFILMLAVIGLVYFMCHSHRNGCHLGRKNEKHRFTNSHLNFQIATDSKLISNYVEVRGTGTLSQTHSYKVPSDVMVFKPCSPPGYRHSVQKIEPFSSEWSGEATDNLTGVINEVGQLNTDWRSSEPYIASKISSQYLEENLAQDEIKREFNRRHTAITSAADAGYIEASPDLEDGIPTWAPRYGSQQLEHQEPDEYQPSIYMGGSPVRLPAKQDQVAKLDGQQSASSTKKKKKRSKRTEKRESKVTVEEPQNE
uniref:Protocadherin mu3 n=1 Tax=Callorhinchus milii TaxID=7868 RepID=B0YN79_CALMI|nr:protocadherin mu3 [Callorhinchus milii]